MRTHFRSIAIFTTAFYSIAGCGHLNSSTDDATQHFRDCEDCPEMLIIPGGQFLIGSPETEAGHGADEGPQKLVNISSFSASRFEITVGEFRAFTEKTDHAPDPNCLVMEANGTWNYDPDATWQSPGFEQEENHPVVCISWNTAKAYVDWLNSQTSQESYRLLTESEWAYTARSKTTSAYWWGDEENDFCQFTNGVDQTAKRTYPGWQRSGQCDDGFLYTAPVGHYQKPNVFGVEDMVGNVWEWVEDCYVSNFENHPLDGSAIAEDPCEKRVLRGGAWGDYGSFYLRSAYRGAWSGDEAFSNLGFRVAKTLQDNE